MSTPKTLDALVSSFDEHAAGWFEVADEVRLAHGRLARAVAAFCKAIPTGRIVAEREALSAAQNDYHDTWSKADPIIAECQARCVALLDQAREAGFSDEDVLSRSGYGFPDRREADAPGAPPAPMSRAGLLASLARQFGEALAACEENDTGHDELHDVIEDVADAFAVFPSRDVGQDMRAALRREAPALAERARVEFVQYAERARSLWGQCRDVMIEARQHGFTDRELIDAAGCCGEPEEVAQTFGLEPTPDTECAPPFVPLSYEDVPAGATVH